MVAKWFPAINMSVFQISLFLIFAHVLLTKTIKIGKSKTRRKWKWKNQTSKATTRSRFSVGGHFTSLSLAPLPAEGFPAARFCNLIPQNSFLWPECSTVQLGGIPFVESFWQFFSDDIPLVWQKLSLESVLLRVKVKLIILSWFTCRWYCCHYLFYEIIKNTGKNLLDCFSVIVSDVI